MVALHARINLRWHAWPAGPLRGGPGGWARGGYRMAVGETVLPLPPPIFSGCMLKAKA